MSFLKEERRKKQSFMLQKSLYPKQNVKLTLSYFTNGCDRWIFYVTQGSNAPIVLILFEIAHLSKIDMTEMLVCIYVEIKEFKRGNWVSF